MFKRRTKERETKININWSHAYYATLDPGQKTQKQKANKDTKYYQTLQETNTQPKDTLNINQAIFIILIFF